jgi:hypothetical protein
MGNNTISRRMSGFRGPMLAGAVRRPASKLAGMEKIELESQSRSPVSQAVARPGTTEWHPHRG